jgi:hypothetical protein
MAWCLTRNHCLGSLTSQRFHLYRLAEGSSDQVAIDSALSGGWNVPGTWCLSSSVCTAYQDCYFCPCSVGRVTKEVSSTLPEMMVTNRTACTSRGHLKLENVVCLKNSVVFNFKGQRLEIVTDTFWKFAQLYVTWKWRLFCVCTYIYTYIYISTSQKVEGSIADGVIGIFHWHNPFGRTMALVSTRPLTEMSTGSKRGRCVGLTNLPPSCADCLEIWELQPPGILRACPGR